MNTFETFLEILESRIAPATIVVDTTSDDPNTGTTLREAIDLANQTPKADKIVFAKSLFVNGPQTIQLMNGQLDITSALNIVGPGKDKLTINGAGNSGVFHIDDSTTANVKVSLSGMSITGGNLPFGGGVYNDENLLLNKVAIFGNEATLDGGGVYSSGSLTISNSVIIGNQASKGGGLALSIGAGEKLSITKTLISGNTATSNGGGGLFIDSSDNTKISFKNVKVVSNYSQGASGYGAGIFMSVDGIGAKISFQNSSLTGNTAAGFGGGLYVKQPDHAMGAESNQFTLSLKGSTISNNFAVSGGGGMYVDIGNNTDAVVSISKSSIQQNGTILGHGGGIFLSASAAGGLGKMNISSSSITGNSATAAGSALGGGLYVENSTMKLSKAQIIGNTTDGSGAGAYVSGDNASLIITKSGLMSNSAKSSGGAIAGENGADVTLSKSTVQGNHASNSGGGVALFTGDTLTISSSKFLNNSAASAGAVSNFGATGKTSILSSSFLGNTALGAVGGAIAVTSDNAVDLVKLKIADNHSAIAGGGLYLSGNGTFNVTRSKIYSNYSGTDGGGIYANAASLTLTKTKIFNNSVLGTGGGIYNANNMVPIVLNKTAVASNTASADPNIYGAVS